MSTIRDPRIPVAQYLNTLKAPSARVMEQALLVAWASLRGRSPVDRRHKPQAEKANATKAAHEFNWAAMDPNEVARLLTRLARANSASTVNKVIAALRGVWRASMDLGMLGPGQLAELLNASQYLPASGSLSERVLTGDQVQALINACAEDPEPLATRNRALLTVLLATGGRRVECAALPLGAYEPKTRRLIMPADPPHPERRVVLTRLGQRHLDAWLERRGGENGPLLLPVSRGGEVVHRTMTDQAIHHTLRVLSQRARIEPWVTTRDLRRTFIVDLGRRHPVSAVMALAGHKFDGTTDRYTQLVRRNGGRTPVNPFIDVARSLKELRRG